jgi:gliding motility-associated-like protein
MKKLLLRLFFIGCFFSFLPGLYAQSNQTVPNGGKTTAENFSGGCTYKWVNSDPSIGLAASGTGDISSFTAVNSGSSPVTATITATPIPSGYAYITNTGSNNVSVVSTALQTVVATIPVGSTPFGVSVSPDGSLVYITNKGDNTVSVINTSTNKVTATVNVGKSPTGIVVGSNGKQVYVANYASNSVSVIDATTNMVSATIHVGQQPYGIAVSPDGSKVYVTNYKDGTVSVINTALNSLATTFNVEQGPTGIAVSPDNNMIYISNFLSKTVSIFNASNNSNIKSMSVIGMPMGIVVSPDGTKAYLSTNGYITIIFNDYSVENRAEPSGLGISITPDGSMVYMPNKYGEAVDYMSSDITTGGEITTGEYPTCFGNFIGPNRDCQSSPVTFTITVNPLPNITVSTVDGTISACEGTASASPAIQQFTVSGSNLTAPVTATAPTGFEVSLTIGSGYGKSVTLNQSAGNLSNTTIYIRSAAGDAAGNISGNVILSSAGAANQSVGVSGIVNALPTVNTVSNQTVTSGSVTNPINFSGSGNTFIWTNDNSGIGLQDNGTGNIPPFTAINKSNSTVIANVTVKSINKTAGFEYITNETSGQVSVISNLTNTIVSTINVGAGPYGITLSADGSMAYVANYIGSSVSVINTSENKVIATLPVGEAPIGIAINTDGNKVYVSCNGSIFVIDALTNKVITGILLSNYEPAGLTVSPDGKWLYVADPNNNALVIISTSTYQKTSISFPTNQEDSAFNVATSPDGSLIYITGANSKKIFVIDAATQKIISPINLTEAPIGIAVSPDGRHIYVTNEYSNSVSVVNATNGALITTIPVGSSPEGISVSPDGSLIYVINVASNTMSVINALTNKVTTTINTGLVPHSVGNFIRATVSCSGPPVSFSITVNPASAALIVSEATGAISTCVGSASVSPAIQQFTVSGSNLTAPVTATAPTGFEVSLTTGSGYGKSVTLNQSAGNLSSTTIYIRSAAGDAAGNISGNVILSSAGAADQSVGVSGIVNALPTVNAVSNQTLTSGSLTTAVNFTGNSNTFAWTNDTPTIGLAASGTGDIPSFTAINKGATPVKATVTVTPYSGGYAYVANTQSNNVSVINTITNTVVKTIGVGGSPLTVAVSPDDSKVYVANSLSDNLSVISTASNTVITTVPMQVSPSGMVFSPDGSELYVASIGSNVIYIVNTSTNSITGSITGNYIGFGMAITPDGKTLYVADESTHYVSALSTVTNSLITDISVGGDPYDVVISPDGTTVYAINDQSGDVSVINTATNKVSTTFKVGLNPYGAVISPDGKRLYVANQTSGTISVINTADQSLITLINTGGNPSGVSLNGDGSLLYAADHNNGVIVINTATNTVLTKVTVGTTPISMGNFITKGTGCPGVPTSFTITVNPIPPIMTASAVSGNISACAGAASSSPAIEQFIASGSGLAAGITATAPAGFELSLNSNGGYNNSLTLTPANGTVSNTTVYIRSSATAPVGSISGNVILSSVGATDQSIAVSGIINAIAMVNTPSPQTLVNGSATAPVNFTGTADTYSWTNNSPTIGLAASGTGDIPVFTAINNTINPITATITVTPLNGTGCNGTTVEFTITVDPSPASLTPAGALTPLTTIYGSPSPINRFTVSGTAITSGILVTPPAGFEVSLNERDFSPTVTVSGTGNIPATAIFIRLAASTHVGDYSGNVTVSTNNSADATLMVPVSTVTRASLTITADNKTRPFGTDNPPLTVTYTGFVNNDGAAQLTALPGVTTTATISSAVGQYPINVDNNAASPDYLFKYNPGILTITPILSVLNIPNTFTPNGDGINDTWVIKDLEYYQKATMNIFNRWGQKVFTSVGYPIPWDGTYQGKALPAGTYYYMIDPKTGQELITGWVAIIR